jgi:short-subunit dehydrogenase
VVAEELAAGGTHLVLTARTRQQLTKLRRKLRSAHGVEIEVLAVDLGEPRARQESFAFTEERGHPVGVDLDGDFARRCLKLDRERCAATVSLNLHD